MTNSKQLSRWLFCLGSLLIASNIWGQALFLPPSSYGNAELSMPETTSFYENVFQDTPAYEAVLDFPADSWLWQAARPIGRLDILLQHRDGRRLATYCTASLISYNLIMTAHHCVPGIDPNFRVIQAELRMDYLARNIQGEAFPVDISPLETNLDYDYSILRVEGEPGRSYGTITLQTHTPQAREPLFLIHHPQGSPKQITRRHCLLHNSQEAVSSSELRHRCDSQGGSSGGLLFSGQNQQVLGMHWGGYDPSLPDPERYNVAKRLSALIAQSPILQRLLQLANASQQSNQPSQQPQPNTQTITTSGIRSSNQSATTNTPTSPSSAGFLQLNSSPQGAEVYLGSRLLGITPIQRLSLPVGVYTLRLAKVGYDIREANLTIASDKLSSGTVPLLLQGQGRILRPYGEAAPPHIAPHETTDPSTNTATPTLTTSLDPLSIIPNHLANNVNSSNNLAPASSNVVILENPFQLLSSQEQLYPTASTDNDTDNNIPLAPFPPTHMPANSSSVAPATTSAAANNSATSYNATVPGNTQSPTQVNALQDNWQILAQGTQSSLIGTARIFSIENENQLFNLWGQAYAGALRLPSLPSIDFSKQAVIAIFAGAQPRHNSFVVERISLEPSTHIKLRLVEPETTVQRGSSPWIFIRLPKDTTNNPHITINNQAIELLR